MQEDIKHKYQIIHLRKKKNNSGKVKSTQKTMQESGAIFNSYQTSIFIHT